MLSLIIQWIPFFPLKVMISSSYQIIPFFNNKILNGIIIGEIIGRIYYIDFVKEKPKIIMTVILSLPY